MRRIFKFFKIEIRKYCIKVNISLNNSVNVNTNNHFTDYIYQEKEYLKRSVAENNGPEKDFDFEIKKG